MRCIKQPILMLRTRGLAGTYMQQWGPNSCVRGQGAAFAPGGSLSGPKATSVWVNAGEPNFTYIRFTQPVQTSGSCALPFGMTVEIDGVGATITAIVLQDNDTVMRLTVSPAIDPGDVVVWQYIEGDPACLLDADGDPIGDQGPLTAQNDLVLAGELILLESGGTNIFLLEDDTDGSSGIELETAGAPSYSPEVQAVLSRMSALSQGEIDAIEAFVDGLVSDGIWLLLDEFFCFALNGTDWLTGFKQVTGTVSGVVNRTADGAQVVSSGGNRIETGLDLSVLVNYRLQNAEVGLYLHSASDWGSSNYDLCGVNQAGDKTRIRHQGTDTNDISAGINGNLNIVNPILFADVPDTLFSVRSGVSQTVSLVDGVLQTNVAGPPVDVPASLDFWLFQQNTNGSPANDSRPSVISASYVGAAIDTAQFNTRLRQLLISLGVSGVTP